MDDYEPVGEISLKKWESVLSVNVTGVMLAMSKAVGIFQGKGRGIIINTASIGGVNGGRAGAAYTASKYALVGLTRNTGFMYAKEGIRCNAIAPGGVETNISSSVKEPSKFGQERTSPGLNLNPRIGKPEEIADIALFLASDASNFINGEVIVADAGWTAY
jgi:NAD(P)-dependent dehydrogenase (short-subunit alcohol dehydrogenase family)